MQTSTSASTSDVDFSEWHRAMLRIRTTCVRSALTGLILRGGLHVLSSMIFLLSKLRSSKKARKRALSWMDALIDTARFTALLGSMGGVYVLLDEGLSILLGKDRTSKWRSLIAGAAAGQLLRLTGSETKHYSLATYVMLRGLTLLVRSANREEKSSSLVHKLLALTRLEHGDTVLMCLSTSQIIYSFVMMPSTLPRSYIRFLTKQAAADSWVIKAMQELAVRNWSGIKPGHLQLLQGTPYAKLKPLTPCAYWHPGQSCPAHTVSVIPSSYLRALGVYVPVYLLPALLVHRQLLITKPYQIWPKIAVGIARSSLFLTVFVTLGFGALCAASNLAGTFTGPLIAGSVWLGGLATLLEKKSRRMELAMYCLSRALEAFGR
ncbi:hypothetical protein CEUSTIGMA_g10853.t1 [Chlamydomonas eustigma]|uniref:Transmembrane protein 135 N-terminal domain-containing protein n=1 Tax=Chlamydomonas eustigma TaxID=1157962 RepID=A0A250XK30_9CHLO|nr:hypothetical protein CEUSTIGMA_g10853.t1 [Chlamydomonas eustigma]|eukprot:GAX83428.1 hypothetical protein CEUSTIGMA_g10853.t1 [Chlamydomonas eustigma]